MNNAGQFWIKNWRIATVLAGFVIVASVVYSLRMVLAPFMVGLAVAYITLPMVSWVERRFPRDPRWLNARHISAIAIVYTLLVAALSVLTFFILSAIADSVHSLAHNSLAYYTAASDTLKLWTESVRQAVPAEFRGNLDNAFQEMGHTLIDSGHYALMDGLKQLPSTLGFILGLTGVPFFLFYILKDRDKISGSYAVLPEWARPHARSILHIFSDAFGRYIRSSLTLGLVVGTITLIGLSIIGVPLAPVLAIVAGITEMIPTVGPWIGGITAVVVTLALAPDKAIWVAGLFLFVQLLENTLLVPRIQSAYFNIHPALTIVLLVVGVYLAGFWGLVLTLPLTATTVGIYKYCCQVTQEESGLAENPANTHDSQIS